jgi:hypothetical protein
MLKNISRLALHDFTHFAGLLGLAVGLVCSKAILSISIVVLIANLVFQGRFSMYWKNLSESSIMRWLILYWSFHIIGLIWTTDVNYAFNDIRIKLSVLLLPMIFIMHPLKSKKQQETVLWIFLLTLLITSITNIAAFHQLFGQKTYADMRDLSLFGSHIRYSLLVIMGIATSSYLLQSTVKKSIKILLLISFIWLLYYTYFSQVLSGVLALVAVCVVWLIRYSFLKSKLLGSVAITFIVSAVIAVGFYLFRPDQLPTIDKNTLPIRTAQGHLYSHNLDPTTFERGKPVLAFLCEEELREAWNTRSSYAYDGKDNKGQVLRFVVMRYLTSLDLRKDAEGIRQLTARDIHQIEQGIARADAHKFGVFSRLEEIRMQLHHPINPNGYTLLQRIEYWKAALHIIRNNWFIGVGTGDVQASFDNAYKNLYSNLLPENRLRAHNTYFTTWVTFGLVGFIVFGLFLVQLTLHFVKPYHFLGISFVVILLVSFLLEDTLETQTGASFFGFFIGLFSMRSIEDKAAQDKVNA